MDKGRRQELTKLDKFKRTQPNFFLIDMFPSIKGFCACGCNTPLKGKQTRWADQKHVNNIYTQFAIIKGNSQIIRQELYKRDQGVCLKCGLINEKWEADHIIPVQHGGGACGLSNFQTLCQYCHKEKTAKQRFS